MGTPAKMERASELCSALERVGKGVMNKALVNPSCVPAPEAEGDAALRTPLHVCSRGP